MLSAASAVLLAASLAGCSASGGDGRECQTVPADLLERIALGSSGDALTPVAGGAVASASFDDAYIVAMEFEVPGNDNQVGAWAVGSLEDGATTVLAVDGLAQQFTQWPSEINGEKLDVREDGVTEAKACLEQG
ncbi:hypothetical protein [Microterricola viridarii]|uniref:Lipoprotein n=1 Tax=Microterricola viridarii TaxID=412690 RepID=A0A109QWL2_9MICO|nr:hypothetical protein [Microterricola viridarii]AMB58230.1 hypothetical protein AWU67_04505 [Microterricola viridarii]